MPKTVFEEPHDEMDMPTPCQHCGSWFDLNDGAGSEKWYPNTVICDQCADEETKEIEREEEIDSLKTELADAEYTVKYCKEQLKKLGVENF